MGTFPVGAEILYSAESKYLKQDDRQIREGGGGVHPEVSEVDNEITTNTHLEATQRVVEAKLTRLTHNIIDTTAPNDRELNHLQFSLQAASPGILDTPSYLI
jgi:hypothetical protein